MASKKLSQERSEQNTTKGTINVSLLNKSRQPSQESIDRTARSNKTARSK